MDFEAVEVYGISDGVSVSSGGSHNCVKTAGGGLKCWGFNDYGQLGDGTAISKSTPVDVGGLTPGVSAVAAGGNHTCALTVDGGVKCWGSNGSGQGGDGTNSNRYTPVSVSGLGSGVIAIATGFTHSCALTSSGGVKCWGYNVDGQLGDGTTTSRYTPVDVSGLTSGATAISVGEEASKRRIRFSSSRCLRPK